MFVFLSALKERKRFKNKKYDWFQTPDVKMPILMDAAKNTTKKIRIYGILCINLCKIRK